ncbi:hypothetical protein [Ornithinibacillus contaminans]|uniref:hypothetical protein n=1 Tax=Ornithinibacillus contaminans TaxID=694055 RepID=UPI00064DE5F1|nr:hypothetical protein [Ornithinibacillus contaminans]
MKKFVNVMFMSILLISLIACSNTSANEVTFEQRINETLKENDAKFDTIIDYDIKDDYIFVVYQEIGTNALFVSVLEENEDELKWIGTQTAQQDITFFGEEGTPIITIIRTEQPAKEVKVLNEQAKMVRYNHQPIEGVTLDITYWVAYSSEVPDSEDAIEVIYE